MDEQRKTAFPLLDHAPKNSIHDQLDKFRGFGARLVRNKKLLSVCDQLLAACFVTPITVMIWAAVWALIDVFYARYFPVYPSLFMAFCIIISFSIVREVLQLTIKDDESCWWKHTLYFIVKLVYMHVFFVCNILTWRGSWAFMFDYMEPYGIGFLMAVSIGCVVLLCCLKCMKNTLASPFVLVVDSDSLFDFPSRFKTRVGEKTHLYILDCLFSVIVVGTLVVFVWRGVWVLLDILLFPDNPVWSAWSSLVLGYCIAAIAFLLQPIMKWACDKLNTCPRLVVADLFLLGSLIATVNVWRGIWNLLNIYLLPGDTEASCWITHCVCLTFLVLMGCSNSLLVRGVYIDAEEPGGKCVIFPCYYLRVLFQEERQKKLNENLRSVEIRREEDGKTGAEMNNVAGVEVNSKVNHITT